MCSTFWSPNPGTVAPYARNAEPNAARVFEGFGLNEPIAPEGVLIADVVIHSRNVLVPGHGRNGVELIEAARSVRQGDILGYQVLRNRIEVLSWYQTVGKNRGVRRPCRIGVSVRPHQRECRPGCAGRGERSEITA